MTVNEALRRMRARIEEAVSRLSPFGVELARETEYMNSLYKPTEDEKRARFISVSVIISAEGLKDEDVYYLTLSAEIKRGQVNEELLQKSENEFERYLSDAEKRLGEAENPAAALAELSAEANAEWTEMLGKLETAKKRATVVNIVGGALMLIGIVILILLAVL